MVTQAGLEFAQIGFEDTTPTGLDSNNLETVSVMIAFAAIAPTAELDLPVSDAAPWPTT